ncbi:39S ribosomal protein L42, mitochondrial [Rhipicephalus sanguineus]|uniref:39S ribosomal protein L42, mitochondrial n=1 Tax=Rhipicephalus sanguineus TaxID=34632 RepID=UPI001892F887|nr:39S ribosomal protein L42, mitochondrial [Rhipicephalus sanguineus]XP_037519105.1 39S ribosomal protein L42, mitochondrial [Rhipicephalus sanguineus]
MLACRRLLALRSQTKLFSACAPHQRQSCSTSQVLQKSQSKERIVLTDDGSTIVCWHPQEEFPYEHTKPLPHIRPKLDEANSALKLQYRLEEAETIYRNDRLEIEALTKMTYTSKHRWYPNNKKKYLDPNPPIEREGL